MPEAATTTRKRTAKPPALTDALDVLKTALADPEHPEHQAALDYVDDNFARQAEETIPEGMRPRNIVEALVAVMREVRAVGKDGRNTQGKGYDFRGIDGTINALGPAMRKVGVIPMPSVKSHLYGEVEVGGNRTKQAHSRVEVEYTFHYSNEQGELSHLTAYVPGEAMDSGDKATAKSMSVAFRTCLLQTFAVPTHERDPDEDTYVRSGGPEPINATELKNACKHATTYDDLDQGFNDLRRHYGDRLAVSTAVTAEGETLPGDEYVTYAQGVAAAWRAQKAAEEAAQQQDADAQGKTTETGQPATEDQAADQVVAQTKPDETRPGASTPPADHSQPRQQPQGPESKTDRLFRLGKAEAEFQAESMGIGFGEHVAPILTEPGNTESIDRNRLMKFVKFHRPATVEALRKQGDSSKADVYERIAKADAFPVLLDQLFAPAETR